MLDNATVSTFLPPTRTILRHVAVIAVLSMIGGPLVGLYVYNAPRGEMLTLSLSTGLGWGISFAFVAGFVYVGWLLSRAWKGYHKHMMALKLAEYYRATEGDEDRG